LHQNGAALMEKTLSKISITITTTDLGYSVKMRGHGEIDFIASDPKTLGKLIAQNIERIFEQREKQ
jgi:hypothetical protein